MPVPRQSWTRPALLAVALLASLAVIGGKLVRLTEDPSFLPPDDYVEYWAAGRLNVEGKNPYDGDLLLPLEREAGRDTDKPVMMWNPPWTLAVAMPLGLLPARLGQIIWLGVSLGFVLFSADRLWLVYGGAHGFRWVAWLLSLSFLPTIFALQAGQIGPFILLGITGFLWYLLPLPASGSGPGGEVNVDAIERDVTSIMNPMLAGGFAVLMAIKPHLLYLFWVALAGWAIVKPISSRWKVIAGGMIFGTLATGIALSPNPRVLGQYWEALRYRTPDQWKSPTIGSYLRDWFDDDFGLQFLATIFGFVWLVWYVWSNRQRRWEWRERLPMLLFVSFITASYGAWPFDLVILLPGVLCVAANLSFREDRTRAFLALCYFLVVDFIALVMNVQHVMSNKFVWMAPALMIGYLLFRPRRQTI